MSQQHHPDVKQPSDDAAFPRFLLAAGEPNLPNHIGRGAPRENTWPSARSSTVRFMAFLSPDGVAETLVRQLFPQPDQDLGLADAVAELRRFSLIDRDGATLTVHRLVQTVVRSRLDPVARLKRLTSAAELLIGTDPGDPDDPASWRAWSATAPHALVLGRLASESRHGEARRPRAYRPPHVCAIDPLPTFRSCPHRWLEDRQ